MLRVLLSIFPPALQTIQTMRSNVEMKHLSLSDFLTIWPSLVPLIIIMIIIIIIIMITNWSDSGPGDQQAGRTSAPSWDSWRLWTGLTVLSSWSASSTPRRRPWGLKRRNSSSLCSTRTGGSPARPPWLSSTSLPRLGEAPDQRRSVETSTPQWDVPTLLGRWWHSSRVCKTFEWPTRLYFYLSIYLLTPED